MLFRKLQSVYDSSTEETGRKMVIAKKDTKITRRKRKFGKTSELMKIFCFVISASDLSLGLERMMMMMI